MPPTLLQSTFSILDPLGLFSTPAIAEKSDEDLFEYYYDDQVYRNRYNLIYGHIKITLF